MSKQIVWAMLLAIGFVTAPSRAGVDGTGDPAREVVHVILDPASTDKQREEALASQPKLSVEIVRELAANLRGDDAKEEYRRIPWIWRAAIAVGKRNDADEVRKLLKVSLPEDGKPLRDWQAVVIGGGVINGISEQNVYPAARIEEVIKDDEALLKRWRYCIDRAFVMADDMNVKPGTRYDALRMIAMAGWEPAAPVLRKYLEKDAHAELQQGAVSALIDIPVKEALDELFQSVPNLTDANRKLAAGRLKKHPDELVRIRAVNLE
jgi:hypothetical protein